jgi:hypothetical protein
MRKLGNREHEDQVEEQLDERDAVGLVPGAAAQEIAMSHATILFDPLMSARRDGASPTECGTLDASIRLRPPKLLH